MACAPEESTPEFGTETSVTGVTVFGCLTAGSFEMRALEVCAINDTGGSLRSHVPVCPPTTITGRPPVRTSSAETEPNNCPRNAPRPRAPTTAT